MAVVLKGVAKMQDRMNAAMARMGVVTMDGLIEGSIIIRRSTEDDTPITPLDTGNLRASWFTATPRGSVNSNGAFNNKNGDASKMKQNHSKVLSQEKTTVKSRTSPTISLGFSANYSGYVHEMMGVVWQRPGSGSWFLASALMRTKKQVLEAIRIRAKIR